MTKIQLYQEGVATATSFLAHNKIPPPVFLTYDETTAPGSKASSYAKLLLSRVAAGPIQGTGTGLYTRGHVFVNVPGTAAPVPQPYSRAWSWPGWKTDRTATGVVAHEVGHYVEDWLQQQGTLNHKEHGPAWRTIIRGKRVSSYEPVPSEAWAETMRLFILNPDLLRKAIPRRYNFICNVGLQPLPSLLQKGYVAVLQNPAYLSSAERFIRV